MLSNHNYLSCKSIKISKHKIDFQLAKYCKLNNLPVKQWTALNKKAEELRTRGKCSVRWGKHPRRVKNELDIPAANAATAAAANDKVLVAE